MAVSAADIEKGLQGLSGLPVKVDFWVVEFGLDWTNDPAFWVWGILPEADIDIDTQFALREAITGVVRELAGNDMGVYIRFRSTEEQLALPA